MRKTVARECCVQYRKGAVDVVYGLKRQGADACDVADSERPHQMRAVHFGRV